MIKLSINRFAASGSTDDESINIGMNVTTGNISGLKETYSILEKMYDILDKISGKKILEGTSKTNFSDAFANATKQQTYNKPSLAITDKTSAQNITDSMKKMSSMSMSQDILSNAGKS